MTLGEITSALRAAGCVFAEQEAALLLAETTGESALTRMVARRVDGEPLEQILGWVEFCGLRIGVAPGVFVPRRRTQLLARRAIEVGGSSAIVVELCCGAAAVAVAIGSAEPAAQVYAADLDPVAVRCARGNLGPLGGQVFEGDLYEPLPDRLRGRIDVLVANAPYVPSDAVALMPPEARDHEPRLALDGGHDGLVVARRVIAQAAGWLAPGGTLLVETSTRQAADLTACARAAGLTAGIVTDDDHEATALEARTGLTDRTGGA